MNRVFKSRHFYLAAFIVAAGSVTLVLSISHRGYGAPRSAALPPELGADTSLHGKQVFPADDPWNQDVSQDPLDPHSDKLIASIGLGKPLHPDFGSEYQGAPMGIPYVIVAGNQRKVKVAFEYRGESDPGPYPIPPDAPIEGGPKSDGDRHVLIIDRDNWILYELFSVQPPANGKGWKAGSGAVWDLKKVSFGQRPKGATSADAAGLPIFPGLVRYDEVAEQKEIRHALRFTIVKSRRAYVPPATHYASKRTDPNLPPMGMRVRLKAGYDLSGFSPNCQVILKALKKYGMIVADNGSDWFLSGDHDSRWDNEEMHTLTKVKGADFEVLKMGPVTTR
ncbi:MAG TPA: hypothetical protein VFC78_06680 [Tepidisphaeraceae bacterium]|nr:hypothetical protein [Tepidisphaeraceae bacterium]